MSSPPALGTASVINLLSHSLSTLAHACPTFSTCWLSTYCASVLFWCKGCRDLEINSVCPKVSHSGRGTNVIAQNNMLCRNFPQEAIVTEQMPNKSLSCDTVTLTDEVTACEEERLFLTSCNSHSICFLPSILFPSNALNMDLQAPTMCQAQGSIDSSYKNTAFSELLVCSL